MQLNVLFWQTHIPKFPVGRLLTTPQTYDSVPHDEMLNGLKRHIAADWGELDAEDKAANDLALLQGTRLISAYTTQSGVRFWIVTEADRATTTFLLPEEY